jgi:segregation and condensation protein B
VSERQQEQVDVEEVDVEAVEVVEHLEPPAVDQESDAADEVGEGEVDQEPEGEVDEDEGDDGDVAVAEVDHGEQTPHGAELLRVLEGLLFLSSEPLSVRELVEATVELGQQFAPGERGLILREVAGGYTLATDPVVEPAARRLFSRPRVSNLTPAQAETLSIVAYLQPVSRPEITRIRGVSADSAVGTLLDRNLIEESGRSQFGAAMYRTTTLFLKLFGLRSLQELPDAGQFDPTPEEAADLRERLMRAGEARAGGGPEAS